MTELAQDFFGLDGDLSDEERLLRDTVRGFVEARVLPDIAQNFEEGRFDLGLVKEMAKLGLFGMHLEGYGCAGAGPMAYGIACRELEAGDSGLRSFLSVQGSLSMTAIRKFGSEEHCEEFLPAMAAGETLGCFGLTEPDAGSDPASMRTNAKQDGGKVGSDWLLNGTKLWITNGSIADVAVIWAMTEDGVRGFLVPTDAEGFEARDIPRKASMRASITSELTLQDVRVPDGMRLPAAMGLRAPLSCLSEARFGIVFGAAGAARACFEAALEYAGERKQFGQPISSYQLTQEKLVNMLTLLNNSHLIAMQLAKLKAKGDLSPAQVSYGKRHNVAAALEIARTARSIMGANGISLDYPPARHMANLESVYTYEGTHEIHTLILGQAITGQSAFN